MQLIEQTLYVFDKRPTHSPPRADVFAGFVRCLVGLILGHNAMDRADFVCFRQETHTRPPTSICPYVRHASNCHKRKETLQQRTLFCSVLTVLAYSLLTLPCVRPSILRLPPTSSQSSIVNTSSHHRRPSFAFASPRELLAHIDSVTLRCVRQQCIHNATDCCRVRLPHE